MTASEEPAAQSAANAGQTLAQPASLAVFTYGSLMFDAVWRRVVRGHYQSAPAVLRGYRRGPVTGLTYPGIVADNMHDAVVQGVLYVDVQAADLQALDRFEGNDYRRETVRVGMLQQGGVGVGMLSSEVCAEVYVYLRPERLGAGDWSPQRFASHGIHRFLNTYCVDRGV